MYYEGVKYSLSCRGASISRLGSMVNDLSVLQVLSILGSKDMSLDSNDRRPSIHPIVANKLDVSFFLYFILIRLTLYNTYFYKGF